MNIVLQLLYSKLRAQVDVLKQAVRTEQNAKASLEVDLCVHYALIGNIYNVIYMKNLYTLYMFVTLYSVSYYTMCMHFALHVFL